MKRLYLYLLTVLLMFSCKSLVRSDVGSFTIENRSDKVLEFVWLAPEGSFYPTAKEISVGKGEIFDYYDGLKPGIYDVAIDFQNELNSFNSKKDKSLCLEIESGVNKRWIIETNGKIIIE